MRLLLVAQWGPPGAPAGWVRSLRYATLLAASLVLSACNPSLPEPESAGARLYEERCATCHRLYPPNVMTAATWKIMLDRMQREMAMRGVPPLSGDEMQIALDYLSRNAMDAAGRGAGEGKGHDQM